MFKHLTMRLILSTFLLVWSLQVAHSQDKVDPRILQVYTTTDLENQVKANPNRLDYLNLKLNSYKIEQLSNQATKNIFDFLMDDQFDKNLLDAQRDMSYPFKEFNLLLYSVRREYKEESVYKLGESGYQIRFGSKVDLIQEYNSKIENN